MSTNTLSFKTAMEPVARELLGEPNKALSSDDELRFGSRGSLSINLTNGTFYDHSDGKGGGLITFVMREKRVDKNAAVEWLRERKHIDKPKPKANSKFNIAATYPYHDEHGVFVFEVVRLEPKDFRPRYRGEGGEWIWKSPTQRVVYRLPTLAPAIASGRTIYIAEGEKAVDALVSLGLTATCSPHGAGKWSVRYNDTFKGADVVILPDNDPQQTTADGKPLWHPDGRPKCPGQDHADDVARHLQGVAQRVRKLMLPDLPLKGDVADWIAAGGTAQALEDLAADVAACKATFKPKSKPETPPPATDQLAGYDLTEDGIALAFTATHQDRLRYDHTRGVWFQWTGKAWRKDETKLAFSWARRTCREIAKAARKADDANAKVLATLAKAATAAAVERFAQSDPALAVTSAIWDRDAFLMGTPGGTLDLRTGKMRDAVPDDHITKLAAVAPSASADCPQWLTFLKEVTNNDTGLIRFLQQWCGYCLTGDTREHALLFAHGPGGNGKGVFLNTVSGVMGDYAVTAAMDTFTASPTDKHSTDLAMLRGARMVSASETEDGRAWAEARIKTLTGGDPVTARFMRQDFFTYLPQFKLTIIGNHKPILRNVDDAARRRFNMAPFLFKPAAKDKQLEAKLKQEWPGILRWMIEGCLDWKENGLIQPNVVIEATAEYFSEQDTVHQWIEEACNLGKNQSDRLAVLFRSWSDYALANGEKPGATKWFSQTLTRAGCQAVKNTPGHHGKRGFIGIAIKPVQTKDRTQPQYQDDAPPDEPGRFDDGTPPDIQCSALWDAALRHFKGNRDMAELWMNSTDMTLHNRPSAVCDTQFDACMLALKATAVR